MQHAYLHVYVYLCIYNICKTYNIYKYIYTYINIYIYIYIYIYTNEKMMADCTDCTIKNLGVTRHVSAEILATYYVTPKYCLYLHFEPLSI